MSRLVEPWRSDPWEAEARYLPSGLPGNIEAVLHDQWKRMNRRWSRAVHATPTDLPPLQDTGERDG